MNLRAVQVRVFPLVLHPVHQNPAVVQALRFLAQVNPVLVKVLVLVVPAFQAHRSPVARLVAVRHLARCQAQVRVPVRFQVVLRVPVFHQAQNQVPAFQAAAQAHRFPVRLNRLAPKVQAVVAPQYQAVPFRHLVHQVVPVLQVSVVPANPAVAPLVLFLQVLSVAQVNQVFRAVALFHLALNPVALRAVLQVVAHHQVRKAVLVVHLV